MPLGSGSRSGAARHAAFIGCPELHCIGPSAGGAHTQGIAQGAARRGAARAEAPGFSAGVPGGLRESLLGDSWVPAGDTTYFSVEMGEAAPVFLSLS